MANLFGDIRGNYSDYFAVKFDDGAFYELESLNQTIDINDRFCADVNLFSELYNVYDYVNQTDIGEFYEIEKSELLKEIEKTAV